MVQHQMGYTLVLDGGGMDGSCGRPSEKRESHRAKIILEDSLEKVVLQMQ